MNIIEKLITNGNTLLWGFVLIAVLLLLGIYFTIVSRFFGYILLAVFVVITNITEIPHILSLIFKSAFGIEQVVGGGIAAAIMNGVKRGL